MFHVKTRLVWLAWLICSLAFGCGGGDFSSRGAAGNEPITGGADAQIVATGGSAGTEVEPDTGGQVSTGGARSTGGNSAELVTGGNVSTGGAAGTGGASPATGGARSTGGSSAAAPVACVLRHQAKSGYMGVACSCLCGSIDYRTAPCTAADTQCADGNCSTCFSSGCSALSTRSTTGDCFDIAHDTSGYTTSYEGFTSETDCVLALATLRKSADSIYADCTS